MKVGEVWEEKINEQRVIIKMITEDDIIAFVYLTDEGEEDWEIIPGGDESEEPIEICDTLTRELFIKLFRKVY